MEEVKLEDARSRLDELINRAAKGEVIVIETDKGVAAALGPQPKLEARAQKQPFDWDAHFAWLESQPMDPRPPEEIDAELRSLDRY